MVLALVSLPTVIPGAIPMLIFDDGYHMLHARYLILRGSTWQYYRKVPADLEERLGIKFRRVSLRTSDKAVAARKAAKLAAQDDAVWALMRDPESAVSSFTPKEVTQAALATLERLEITPGNVSELDREQLQDYFNDKHGHPGAFQYGDSEQESPSLSDYLNVVDHEIIRLSKGEPALKYLSDALELYLSEHKRGREERFSRETTRAIDLVKIHIGDLPLTDYKAEHGRKMRDIILASGVKTGTVDRQLQRIGAVHKKGLEEFDLPLTRFPFHNVSIPGLDEDKKVRKPFTREELITLAGLIHEADDSRRYILGIQANTGARLAEVVGLRVSDVVLDAPVPHILITPHKTRRTKTMNTRKVPLVGVSLWCAQRAIETVGNGGIHLFPGYMDGHSDSDKAAATASATLNKWIKTRLGVDKTTHCFRHAIRTELRRVEAPVELADMLGGWSLKGIGQGYGEGYTLEQMQGYLLKIAV